MKTYKYSIGPIEGQGRTKTEARRRAEAKAASELTEYAHGFVLIPGPPTMPGATIPGALIIYYALGFWCYEIIGTQPGVGHRSYVSVEGDRKAAIYRAVKHWGGVGFERKAPWEEIHAWLEDVRSWIESVLHDPSEATTLCAEFTQAVAFTKRYHVWLNAGYSDIEAHKGACEKQDPPKRDSQ